MPHLSHLKVAVLPSPQTRCARKPQEGQSLFSILLILLPKSIDRAAFLIVVPAMVDILVIADRLFFQHAVMLSILFQMIVASVTHRLPPYGSMPVP